MRSAEWGVEDFARLPRGGVPQERTCRFVGIAPQHFGKLSAALRTPHSPLRTSLVLFSLFIAGTTLSAVAAAAPSFLFALPASESFAQRDYQRALTDLGADSAAVDSGIRLFRMGVAYCGMGSDQEALSCLRLAAEKSPELGAVAYELIGDITQRRGDSQNALHAYRAAVSGLVPKQYARHVRQKMYNVLKTDSSLAAQISWFTQTSARTTPGDELWFKEFLDTLMSTGQWRLADSLFDVWEREPHGIDTCELVRLVMPHQIPDSAMSTGRLFRLASQACACKLYDASRRWVEQASSRPGFDDSVDRKQYCFLQGRLEAAQGNYARAIHWFDKSERRGGLSPELVLAVARAYRAMGKGAKADMWYDKHIALYPNHPFSADIIWYRAWDREESGKYPEAIQYFTRVQKFRPRYPKADQALFRVGICSFKAGMYADAQRVFAGFGDKYSASMLVTAARYWNARSLLALRKPDEARAIFRSIARTTPWDYYAFTARERLTEMRDTARTGLAFDTTVTLAQARQWLDSLSGPKKPAFSSVDSALWRCGVVLALTGLPDMADYYLDAFVRENSSDLALQFDIAMLYELAGDPTLSYRVGRRFAWRIPEPARQNLALPIYAMLFPLPFRDDVVDNAVRNDVDPLLVCSVMRQESQFDPYALSPVGAMGLMQIMPYTGREIAADLHDSGFVADSLLSASFSVRYGAHYIKKLLDQFDGDVTLAVASYNGGPLNARKWHDKHGEQPADMFIESIGFTETREYVKKVLANLWTYRLIGKALEYPGT